jgi:hypothetical protein
MSKHTTIKVAAAQYIDHDDHDDCLAAAAEDYVSEHPAAAGYDSCLSTGCLLHL